MACLNVDVGVSGRINCTTLYSKNYLLGFFAYFDTFTGGENFTINILPGVIILINIYMCVESNVLATLCTGCASYAAESCLIPHYHYHSIFIPCGYGKY